MNIEELAAKIVDEPIAHGGSDRRYRLCICSDCKIERTCEPQFDFFGDEGQPLLCEPCFRKKLESEGVVPIFTFQDFREFQARSGKHQANHQKKGDVDQ